MIIILHTDALQLLNRRPPFGNEVLASVKQMPMYALTITEENVRARGGNNPIEVGLSIECRILNHDVYDKSHKKSKFRGQDMTIVLTVNSDLDFVDFRRIP